VILISWFRCDKLELELDERWFFRSRIEQHCNYMVRHGSLRRRTSAEQCHLSMN